MNGDNIALPMGAKLKEGRYTIASILGKGSFGITYKAVFPKEVEVDIAGSLGKLNKVKTTVSVPVAIKEFFMTEVNRRSEEGGVEGISHTLARNYHRKFQTEAYNLSRLNHPNIVNVLEVFDENETSYYVMDYIDGASLDDRLKSGPLPEDEALKMFEPICGAVAYMHEHHMLHLDIKPRNIMLDPAGNPILIDFGLSKQFDENGEPESSTTLGSGTMGYAPMEQANYKGDGHLPTTLDVYALGASLFKMLTAMVPPPAADVYNFGLPEEKLRENGVSETTIGLIRHAMEPRVKDRFQTVTEMLDSLHNPPQEPLQVEKLIEVTPFEDEEERTEIGNIHAAVDTSQQTNVQLLDIPYLGVEKSSTKDMQQAGAKEREQNGLHCFVMPDGCSYWDNNQDGWIDTLSLSSRSPLPDSWRKAGFVFGDRQEVWNKKLVAQGYSLLVDKLHPLRLKAVKRGALDEVVTLSFGGTDDDTLRHLTIARYHHSVDMPELRPLGMRFAQNGMPTHKHGRDNRYEYTTVEGFRYYNDGLGGDRICAMASDTPRLPHQWPDAPAGDLHYFQWIQYLQSHGFKVVRNDPFENPKTKLPRLVAVSASKGLRIAVAFRRPFDVGGEGADISLFWNYRVELI